MLEDQVEESSEAEIVTETTAGEAAVAATIVVDPAATAVTEEETDQDPVTAEIAEIVGRVTDPIPGTESLQDVIEAHPMTEEDLDPRAEADLANLFEQEKNQLVFELLIQLFCF